MKSYQLSKDSWHYKLAVFGRCKFDIKGNADFCNYFSSVLLSMCIGVVTGAALLVLMSMIIHVAFGVIFSIIYKTFIFTDSGIIGIFTLGFICIMHLVDKLARRKTTAQIEENSTGFVGLTYKKFKQKVCFNIIFVEDKND